MTCPVGLNATAACAAMRAGIAAFDELPYWDRYNVPVVGAAVPTFDSRFEPRLVRMLATALSECLAGVPAPVSEIPLLVGLAELGRPGAGTWAAQDVISAVERLLGAGFHPHLSAVIDKGHTTAFENLWTARELLLRREIPGCIVCGVDSYINASSIFWLDQTGRLKHETNSDGVMPGEAAAAIYVTGQPVSGEKAGTEVVGLGFGFEEASVLTDEPLLGRGFWRKPVGRPWPRPAGAFTTWTSASGRDGRKARIFEEHALAEGRLARVVRPLAQPLWHPAELDRRHRGGGRRHIR